MQANITARRSTNLSYTDYKASFTELSSVIFQQKTRSIEVIFSMVTLLHYTFFRGGGGGGVDKLS